MILKSHFSTCRESREWGSSLLDIHCHLRLLSFISSYLVLFLVLVFFCFVLFWLLIFVFFFFFFERGWVCWFH